MEDGPSKDVAAECAKDLATGWPKLEISKRHELLNNILKRVVLGERHCRSRSTKLSCSQLFWPRTLKPSHLCGHTKLTFWHLPAPSELFAEGASFASLRLKMARGSNKVRHVACERNCARPRLV